MLTDSFNRYIEENNLIHKDDKVLLAVSGGVDSMVMMDLFSKSGFIFGVAHCNFCLRGKESDEDEEMVERETDKLGIEHFNIRFDTQSEIESSGESVQMVARRLRYEWFDKICSEHGYNKIAIAHHSDDSIETFFINLIRGTGLRGLTGINVIYKRIIRPLLFATRKEISEYAVNNKVRYGEDSSNRSTKYLRNKIRLRLIPKIKEISPNFGRTMTHNVERLSMALQFIDTTINKIREHVSQKYGSNIIINTELIDKDLDINYIIYELLRPYGFNTEVVHDLCRSLTDNNSGTKFHSYSHIAYLDRKKIIIKNLNEVSENYSVEIGESAEQEFCMGGALRFEKLEIEDVEIIKTPDNIAYLDADLITYPLTVRKWKEGDSFVPFGMAGRKKVSDLLINEKVPVPEKDKQLVIESAGNIIWLVGRRTDNRYRITEKTRNILKITKVLNEEQTD
ncbi:MAG: tRNA lysidine(34) synthetase TilS [Rikenellaceae bacterium]|nr:tRNA lysidine(34) synthetase TilS [Rikenellaceae bacterium]